MNQKLFKIYLENVNYLGNTENKKKEKFQIKIENAFNKLEEYIVFMLAMSFFMYTIFQILKELKFKLLY